MSKAGELPTLDISCRENWNHDRLLLGKLIVTVQGTQGGGRAKDD